MITPSLDEIERRNVKGKIAKKIKISEYSHLKKNIFSYTLLSSLKMPFQNDFFKSEAMCSQCLGTRLRPMSILVIWIIMIVNKALSAC